MVTELDEAVRRLVDGARIPPFLYAIGPDDARLALDLMQAPPADPPDLERQTVRIASPHGPLDVHVLSRRDAGTEPRPVILYVHGGGWLVGSYATHHRLATRLCRENDAVVAVPEYSRVPEARHPVAVEQVAATLAWIQDGELPVPADRDRIALVGDCAGATMALAAAMINRDAGRPSPSAQVLLYPMTQPEPGDRSADEFETGAALRLADVRRLCREYASRPDPLADPLGATRLAGLPDTLLITAEADVTRDRTERFGARLRTSGVRVTAVRYLGTVHDFAVLDALRWTPAANAALGQVTDHLRAVFAYSETSTAW